MPDLGRVIICHTLAHMRAAFTAAKEANVPLVIQTATGGLRFAGAEYLKETFRKAAEEFPGVEAVLVLQCDDYAADTVQVMRGGQVHIRSHAPEPTYAKLRSIAGQVGAVRVEGDVQALDLKFEYDPLRACRAWLLKVA
jgi:hypothetical protein